MISNSSSRLTQLVSRTKTYQDQASKKQVRSKTNPRPSLKESWELHALKRPRSSNGFQAATSWGSSTALVAALAPSGGPKLGVNNLGDSGLRRGRNNTLDGYAWQREDLRLSRSIHKTMWWTHFRFERWEDCHPVTISARLLRWDDGFHVAWRILAAEKGNGSKGCIGCGSESVIHKDIVIASNVLCFRLYVRHCGAATCFQCSLPTGKLCKKRGVLFIATGCGWQSLDQLNAPHPGWSLVCSKNLWWLCNTASWQFHFPFTGS